MSDDDPTGPPSTGGWQPPTSPPPTPGPYGDPPPGPPPASGAPPYGAPSPAYGSGYGYGSGYTAYAPPQTEGTAIGALIAAIGSWVVCPISGVVALVLASTAKRKIAESGGRLTGEGLVTASKWVAWINLALWAVFIIFFIFAVVFGILSGFNSDSEFQRLLLAPR
ncbi:MAG: DUF4190 domain-containing protein [Actinobacteria bacterium]|nr:DUF4190 domain-containing protein [Actinomycetota bacterium]